MTIYVLVESEDGTFYKAYASQELAKANKKHEEERLTKKAQYSVKLRVKKAELIEEDYSGEANS